MKRQRSTTDTTESTPHTKQMKPCSLTHELRTLSFPDPLTSLIEEYAKLTREEWEAVFAKSPCVDLTIARITIFPGGPDPFRETYKRYSIYIQRGDSELVFHKEPFDHVCNGQTFAYDLHVELMNQRIIVFDPLDTSVLVSTVKSHWDTKLLELVALEFSK